MESVPPTQKNEIQKLDEQLEEEQKLWNELGMHGNMTVHPPETIWVLKMQMQALMNVLLMTEVITQDDLNIQFKKLMLQDMRGMREQVVQQKRAQIVAPSGIQIPRMALTGKDGKKIEL